MRGLILVIIALILSAIILPIGFVVGIMPTSTPEERLAKSRAFNAFEYSNTILRSSPTVNQIAGIIQLSKEQVDSIYITAKTVEA